MLGRPLDGQRPAADDDEDGRRAGRDDAPRRAPAGGRAGRGRGGRATRPWSRRRSGRSARRRRRSRPRHRERPRPPRRCSASSPSRRPMPRAYTIRSAPNRSRSASRIVGIAGQLVDRVDDVARREARTGSPGGASRERLDVEQVGVVAEQVAGAVGDRADDGDPRRLGARAAASRRSRRATIDRRARSRASALLVGVERCRGRRASAARRTGRSKRPEPELEPEHPLDGEVDEPDVDAGRPRSPRGAARRTRRSSAARCPCRPAAPSPRPSRGPASGGAR